MQRALHSLQNGACVQFEGAGLPQGIQRPSVCVIYPSWKIQTYECACCCESKDRLRDSGSAQSSPCTMHPPAAGFLNVHLCRFQPGQRKGHVYSSAWGSARVFSLSSFKGPERDRMGIQRSPQAPGISELSNVSMYMNRTMRLHAVGNGPHPEKIPTQVLFILEPFVQGGFILVH